MLRLQACAFCLHTLTDSIVCICCSKTFMRRTAPAYKLEIRILFMGHRRSRLESWSFWVPDDTPVSPSLCCFQKHCCCNNAWYITCYYCYYICYYYNVGMYVCMSVCMYVCMHVCCHMSLWALVPYPLPGSWIPHVVVVVPGKGVGLGFSFCCGAEGLFPSQASK